MPATLRKVEPIRADLLPPLGAVHAGITPNGKQVYKMTTTRSRSEPRINPETGEQEWRKNPLNGEPLVPLRRPVIFQHEEMFILEDQGNGNVEKVAYHFPTEAELRAAERAQKIASIQTGLAERLVDSGLSLDDILARITLPLATTTAAAVPVTLTPIGPTVTETFPQHIAGQNFRLSDGSVFRGNKVTATAAQDAMNQAQADAKAAAEATPEI